MILFAKSTSRHLLSCSSFSRIPTTDTEIIVRDTNLPKLCKYRVPCLSSIVHYVQRFIWSSCMCVQHVPAYRVLSMYNCPSEVYMYVCALWNIVYIRTTVHLLLLLLLSSLLLIMMSNTDSFLYFIFEFNTFRTPLFQMSPKRFTVATIALLSAHQFTVSPSLFAAKYVGYMYVGLWPATCTFGRTYDGDLLCATEVTLVGTDTEKKERKKKEKRKKKST